MNIRNLPLPKSSVWILFALMTASIVSVALFVVRVLYSGTLTHAYLVWNLFLAWVPVGFALLCVRAKGSPWRLACYAGLWLLFLPNAPYLVTDLVHLRPRAGAPFWFDMVLFQCFIGLGLLLGFVSLYWMQQIASERVGFMRSWMFVLLVVGLVGFGVYLGRFQRWNSWDLFVNPYDLAVDILRHFMPPKRRVAGAYSILYAGFFLASYLVLYALTHFKAPISVQERAR